MAVAGLTVLALPWPRAAAQRLWDRLSLGRVEIVQISRKDLPESVTALFTMEDRNRPMPEAVRDLADAERVAGFRPSLPPPGVLSGTPQLSVVRSVAFTTLPLRTADIERALAAAGISDLTVPGEWEGTTLTAEGGPMVVATYPDAMVEVMQSPPFRMTTPPGFRFDRFMEIAFRVFGRSAHDARTLAKEIAANPALVMHFPEHDQVREVSLAIRPRRDRRGRRRLLLLLEHVRSHLPRGRGEDERSAGRGAGELDSLIGSDLERRVDFNRSTGV